MDLPSSPPPPVRPEILLPQAPSLASRPKRTATETLFRDFGTTEALTPMQARPIRLEGTARQILKDAKDFVLLTRHHSWQDIPWTFPLQRSALDVMFAHWFSFVQIVLKQLVNAQFPQQQRDRPPASDQERIRTAWRFFSLRVRPAYALMADAGGKWMDALIAGGDERLLSELTDTVFAQDQLLLLDPVEPLPQRVPSGDEARLVHELLALSQVIGAATEQISLAVDVRPPPFNRDDVVGYVRRLGEYIAGLIAIYVQTATSYDEHLAESRDREDIYNDRLRAKDDDLQAMRDALAVCTKNKDALASTLSGAQETMARQEGELNTRPTSEAMARLQAELAAERATTNELRDELRDRPATEELRETRDRAVTAEVSLARQNATILELQQQVASQKRRADTAEESLVRRDATINDLLQSRPTAEALAVQQKRAEDAEAGLRSARTTLQRLGSVAVERLVPSQALATALDREILYTEQLEALQMSIGEATEANASLRQQLANLDARSKNLFDQLQNQQLGNENLRANLLMQQQIVADNNQKLAEKQDEIDVCKTSITTLQSNFDKYQIEATKAHEDLLSRYNERLQDLGQQLTAAQRDGDTLTGQVENLTAELATTQQQLGVNVEELQKLRSQLVRKTESERKHIATITKYMIVGTGAAEILSQIDIAIHGVPEKYLRTRVHKASIKPL